MATLVNLPISIVTAIFIAVLTDDAVSALHFGTTCKQLFQIIHCDLNLFQFLLETDESLFTAPPETTVYVFPTFKSRCRVLLDAIYEYQMWYCSRKFRDWLRGIEISLGRNQLVALAFQFLRPEMVKLLTRVAPPTLDDLLGLSLDGPVPKCMGVYLCIVMVGKDIRLYVGSATNQIHGFHSRFRDYRTLDYMQLPKFLRDLIDSKTQFKIIGLVPVAFAADLDLLPGVDMQRHFTDSRIVIFFIESLMMYWLRAFRSGGGYEKVMEHTPWAGTEWSFIGSNTQPSMVGEWPHGMGMSKEEARAYRAAYAREWRKTKQGKEANKKNQKRKLELGTRKTPRAVALAKISQHKYEHSTKGRANRAAARRTERAKKVRRLTLQKYRASDKGREAGIAYRATEKAKEAVKRGKEKFLSTEKGKEAARLASYRWQARKKIKQDGAAAILTDRQKESLLAVPEEKLSTIEKELLGLDDDEDEDEDEDDGGGAA